MANYPADGADYRRARRPPPMASANRYLPPLGRQQPESDRSGVPPRGPDAGERITVTRAAVTPLGTMKTPDAVNTCMFAKPGRSAGNL